MSQASKADPREVALRVLMRLDLHGAYSQIALEAEARRAGLEARERALALELVQGTTRWRMSLDHGLDRLLKRGLDSLDPTTRNILRLGAYQILYLDRVAPAVAVDTAVEQVRRQKKGQGLAGVVNAVLRTLVRQGAPALAETDPLMRLSLEVSHPLWAVRALVEQLGLEEARAFCLANQSPAPLVLRLRGPDAKRAIESEGGRIHKGAHAPQAAVVEAWSRPFASASFQKGAWVAQDEASQLVAHLVAPRPGERVLDGCAAPGTKSAHLADLMDHTGEVISLEVRPNRAGLIEETCRRLGLGTVRVTVGDLLTAELRGPFQRVLLDAPCSGLGTWRRHPEARWRRTEADVLSLASLQRDMLHRAASLVAPGGTLVYSVCTITRQEGPDQIRALLAEDRGLRLIPPEGPVDWSPFLDDEGFVRTYPHRHGTDGFFCARMGR